MQPPIFMSIHCNPLNSAIFQGALGMTTLLYWDAVNSSMRACSGIPAANTHKARPPLPFKLRDGSDAS